MTPEEKEEKIRDFYKIDDGTLHDYYVIAESIEEALAKWRKIDPDAIIESINLVGTIHE